MEYQTSLNQLYCVQIRGRNLYAVGNWSLPYEICKCMYIEYYNMSMTFMIRDTHIMFFKDPINAMLQFPNIKPCDYVRCFTPIML